MKLSNELENFHIIEGSNSLLKRWLQAFYIIVTAFTLFILLKILINGHSRGFWLRI
jgi:hypothetical protein